MPVRLASRVAARAYVEGLDALEDLTIDAFRDAESYRYLALAAVEAYQREYRRRRQLQTDFADLRRQFSEKCDELRRYTAAQVRDAA